MGYQFSCILHSTRSQPQLEESPNLLVPGRYEFNKSEVLQSVHLRLSEFRSFFKPNEEAFRPKPTHGLQYGSLIFPKSQESGENSTKIWSYGPISKTARRLFPASRSPIQYLRKHNTTLDQADPWRIKPTNRADYGKIWQSFGLFLSHSINSNQKTFSLNQHLQKTNSTIQKVIPSVYSGPETIGSGGSTFGHTCLIWSLKPLNSNSSFPIQMWTWSATSKQ